MTGKEIIKILVKAGWVHVSTRGSHYKLKKTGYQSVPVPVHGNKDLGIGLIKTIEKQTGTKLINRSKNEK